MDALSPSFCGEKNILYLCSQSSPGLSIPEIPFLLWRELPYSDEVWKIARGGGTRIHWFPLLLLGSECGGDGLSERDEALGQCSDGVLCGGEQALSPCLDVFPVVHVFSFVVSVVLTCISI